MGGGVLCFVEQVFSVFWRRFLFWMVRREYDPKGGAPPEHGEPWLASLRIRMMSFQGERGPFTLPLRTQRVARSKETQQSHRAPRQQPKSNTKSVSLSDVRHALRDNNPAAMVLQMADIDLRSENGQGAIDYSRLKSLGLVIGPRAALEGVP
ncbi:unnamed protein product [Boreogadus saida]